MASHGAEQLRAIGGQALEASEYLTDDDEGRLGELEDAANDVAGSWSGSNIGYHADVYYNGLTPPPPGRHFSSEWGLMQSVAPGTSGLWREHDRDEVTRAIRSRVEGLHYADVASRADDARDHYTNLKSRFDSIMSVLLRDIQDEYLEQLGGEADKLVPLTTSQAIQAQLPSGPVMSRDPVAIQAGLRAAPHQVVLAEIYAARAPRRCLREVARLSTLAADHVELAAGARSTRLVPTGTRVFIGHGRSLLWHPLKDFLQDRLGLLWDEFNRVPVAGLSNASVLERMLDDAIIAFLILTAEDEHTDGTVHARQNVVHEAGLLQGRLGFSRAIVLLEEDCEEFSNIHGIGQIRFPKGNISAAFEEIRRVLEREGVIAAS